MHHNYLEDVNVIVVTYVDGGINVSRAKRRDKLAIISYLTQYM